MRKYNTIHHIFIWAHQAITPTLLYVKLTSTSLEVWHWRNENLVEEQRAAVHFDGAWQQTTKVVDVPEEELGANDVMIAERGWGETAYRHIRAMLTCSERAVEKRRLCLRRTSAWRGWWEPGPHCGHNQKGLNSLERIIEFWVFPFYFHRAWQQKSAYEKVKNWFITENAWSTFMNTNSKMASSVQYLQALFIKVYMNNMHG